MLPIHTILHPTDFSDPSDYAFKVTQMIARECHAKVVVLHVAGMHISLPQPMENEFGLAFDCSGDYQTFHDSLKLQLEQFEKNPKIEVETRLVYGDAPTDILQTAHEIKCDLIVMGTHGRSGLGHLLMGSVAEAVLQRAECPVLTIKNPVKVASDAAASSV